MPELIKSSVLRALGFGLILFGALYAAIAYFPTFEENIADVRKFAFTASLKSIVDQLEEGGIWAYVSGQQFFKGCNTMGVAAAILFAVGAVAGESERGTFEIWLARPISRTRLLLERWVAGALSVAVPVFATTLSINWMLGNRGIDTRFSNELLLLSSTHQTFLLLAIYSLTFAISTIGNNPTRISFGMLFAMMAMFSIYLVDKITSYSLFRLADVERYVELERRMALDWTVCGPLLAFTIACIVFSLSRFKRRVP